MKAIKAKVSAVLIIFSNLLFSQDDVLIPYRKGEKWGYSNKNKEIIINTILGDSEAFQYAQEIKKFLKTKGWSTNGVNQVIYNTAILGQSINPEGTEIIIGTKN